MLLNALIFPALGEFPSSCSTTLTPTNSIKPSIASGYRAALVATGLTSPRSIQFDASGNLLVVEQSTGLTSLHFDDNGGACVSVKSQKVVVEATNLTHGLALSRDGNTLYASSAEAAYSWAYNSANSTVSDSSRTLVSGMFTDTHNTRTLLMSQKINDTLIISRGSSENVDPAAAVISSGQSQIKAFDLSKVPSGGYNFAQDGLRLGWGLRNSVGISEHPQTGGIYSVENSVDDLNRTGQDIHQDNPGEELNFHGYLNGTEFAPQGSNYGYPQCVAAWDVSEIPMNSNLM